MGWNGVALTDREFFKQMARFADVSNLETVQKYWYAACEVIIRELFYNGSCRVPALGTFSTRKVGEQVQIQKGQDGKEVVYKVPEREVPMFTPHDDMINDINMQGVTKAYRRRLKAGALTQRDYERQIRAEALGVVGSLSEERINASKEKFKKVLDEKKKKIKGKVDLTEDED